eukprot:1968797-Prymnesium_polylepis.1
MQPEANSCPSGEKGGRPTTSRTSFAMTGAAVKRIFSGGSQWCTSTLKSVLVTSSVAVGSVLIASSTGGSSGSTWTSVCHGLFAYC